MAVVRALNRSIISARTVQVRSISKDMGLKQADVRKVMTIGQATAELHVASLTAAGARIPLYAFSAKGPMPSRGRGRGVTYRLPGGRGRAEHAFIAKMRSGHIGVFQRRGKGRLPIAELHGPSIPKVFEKFTPEARARGQEQLTKNLAHELTRLVASIAA